MTGQVVANDLSPTRVLVLQNGEVFQGQIQRVENGYLVKQSSRSELQIPLRDVRFVCKSLGEAYRQMTAAVGVSNLRQQLSLAEWCLEQGLHNRAAHHWMLSAATSPYHPKVESLERRLKAARHSASSVNDGNKHQVDLQTKTPLASGNSLPEVVTQRIVLLPFTLLVQPVLINHCAVGACHGGQSINGFRLYRLNGKGRMTQQFTYQNLRSVLKQIDLVDPHRSPLLKSDDLLKPDRNSSVTTIECARAIWRQKFPDQYSKIFSWVLQASGQLRADKLAGERPIQLDVPRPQIVPQNPTDLATDQNLATGPPELPQNVFKRYNKSDPFDPEIYNRRYFASRIEPLTELPFRP